MTEEADKNSQDIIEEDVPESDVNVSVDEGTATYRLNAVGKIGGTYLGVFVFHCTLTPIAFLEADRDYRELLGKNAEFAITTADNVAWNLAQLRQRIISAPPFWNQFNERFGGAHVKDFDIIGKVMTAATIAQRKYLNLLNARHAAAVAKLQKQVEKIQKSDESLAEAEQEELDRKE